MRSDMARLLVDAGRHKIYRTGVSKQWNSREKEEGGYSSALPHREGMAQPWVRNHNYRSLLDNLNPLYGWIGKQVGRPWNKVYSELVQGLKGMPAVHRVHVESHLRFYVDLYGEEHSYYQYYVKNGILLKNKRIQYKRYEPPESPKVIDGLTYIKQEGIWYQVKEVVHTHYSPDGIYNKAIPVRRSLSREKLKELGLKND